MFDWLENDRLQGIRRSEADDHVSASAPLSFCRDICNGSKHAQLEEKGVDLDHGLSAIDSYVIGWDGERSVREVIVAKLVVRWQNHWTPVLEFADACIVEWE